MRAKALGSSTVPLSGLSVAETPRTGPLSFQERLASFQGTGGSSPTAAVTGQEVLRSLSREMGSLLLLQYEISRGTTSLTSNLMKVRHETAKNSIANLR
jgi:hypothetical protein